MSVRVACSLFVSYVSDAVALCNERHELEDSMAS